jgi:RNA-directed DNA polymerase
MKTYQNLYPQIYSFESLYRAYRAARKGKRDRVAVASFEFDLESNLLDLQADLLGQAYQPGAYDNYVSTSPSVDWSARRRFGIG